MPEVLITIAILGILTAIAVPTWQGVIEGRQVDSAANQVASDLRLVHTRATNQLADFEVAYTSGSSNYEIRRLTAPGGTVTRTLPDGTQAGTTLTLRFKSDGSVSPVGGGTVAVRVEAAKNTSNHRDIEINTATSRVKVVG